MGLTQEQIAARHMYIGGSDAAAVLGLSRWRSPLAVWASKTGAVPDEDISDKLAIEVGNELEDVVARLFTKKTGKKLNRVNETIFHPKYPFIGANLDRRVVGEDALFEAKTCSGWKAKEWQGDDIPKEYLLQVMHYLAVTGKPKAYLACLIGGNQKFVWQEVIRDEELINDMIAKEVFFWKTFVEPKVMPTTATSDDGDILYKLFPMGGPTEIALNDEGDALCESIGVFNDRMADLKASLDEAKNKLKLMLGENSVGKSAVYKVTWTNQEKKEYTVKASTTRVLRIGEIKQEGRK